MRNYVVIPAYNESSIDEVISQVKKYCKNIIVVDDGSKEKVVNQKAVVLRHPVNLGKGAALKTGCDYALKLGASKIVVVDGDGQHEPKEIARFLKGLQEKDVIFGFRQGGKMPLVLKFGNDFINGSLRLLFGINIKDSQCGYRGFTAEAYKKIRWKAMDYYMETEMAIKAGRKRLKYGQVGIKTIYVDKYKGTTVFDGVKIILKMFAGRIAG